MVVLALLITNMVQPSASFGVSGRTLRPFVEMPASTNCLVEHVKLGEGLVPSLVGTA
jgi:hypothetical protein